MVTSLQQNLQKIHAPYGAELNKANLSTIKWFINIEQNLYQSIPQLHFTIRGSPHLLSCSILVVAIGQKNPLQIEEFLQGYAALDLLGALPKTPYNNQQTIPSSTSFCMNTNKFIVKLLEMMKSSPHIINWTHDGEEIEITNVDFFVREIHPLYFKTSNYQSFLRQLNMYNFRKMSKRRNSVSFRHEQFRRDNESHFSCIKRRKQAPLKKGEEFDKEIKTETDSPVPSSATLPSLHLDSEIRETLSLLKLEVTENGRALVERLERMLEKTGSAWRPASSSRLSEHADLVSLGGQRDYASFCKFEEQYPQKEDMEHTGSSEYNFQSNIFQQNNFILQ